MFQIWDVLHNDFLLMPEMSGMDVNKVKRRTIQVEALGALSARMKRDIDIEVLTGSFLGVTWPPWLFTLLVQERSGGSMGEDRWNDWHVRCWMATHHSADNS